jgi:hypothetical protein
MHLVAEGRRSRITRGPAQHVRSSIAELTQIANVLGLLAELEGLDNFLNDPALSFAAIPPRFAPVRDLLLSLISRQEGDMRPRQVDDL